MDKIGQFVGDMDIEDFKEDDKTMFAVSKAIEIIGEMLKGFPEEIKEQYPAVPWQESSRKEVENQRLLFPEMHPKLRWMELEG